MDETYERILCGINEKYRDYARKLLCWLTFSTRPLRLVEVAEIVAIDAQGSPRFNAENRFFDSQEILVICSSLVSVFTRKRSFLYEWTDGGSEDVPCIKLAHFSVKEYLTSVDIRNGPAKMYAISRELADTSIAESCLALLLHFDKPNSLTSQLEEEGALTSQSRENDPSLGESAGEESLILRFERKFPLAQYAAGNWVKHACNASWDRDSIGGLVSELFTKRDSLENWIRLRRPEESLWGTPDLSKPSNTIGPSIYYVSEAGLLQLLKQLIETGADVNARGGFYGNALQAASFMGHQKIVHLLLDKGADVNAQGGQYGSALQVASFKGHQQIVQILLDAGADVNAKGGEYGSAVQAASNEGHQKIVEILLDTGADVNAQNWFYGDDLQMTSLFGREYRSALQVASYKGYQYIVKMLLDAGADVNAQGGRKKNTWFLDNKEYRSALQVASYEGHQHIVKMLLDAGADVDSQDWFHGNALQAALSRGHQEVAQILRDHGAHEDVESLNNDEDVESLENDEGNEERDGLQSDSHSILPAPTLSAMQ